MTRRRSTSSVPPVISMCTGASKPSCSARSGMSWTWPSVIITTPEIRSDGTSASPRSSAENSSVPSDPAESASIQRGSKPRSRPSRASICSRAAAVSPARSESPWLALVSTTTATMPGSISRSSCFSEGSSSASSSSAAASARSQAPGMRRTSPTAETAAAASAMAAISRQSIRGAKSMLQVMAY